MPYSKAKRQTKSPYIQLYMDAEARAKLTKISIQLDGAGVDLRDHRGVISLSKTVRYLVDRALE